MKCAIHTDVETNLRCGKCGKPICPKCLVQTPVGARCPDCAKLYRLPTFRVSTKYYLRAVGAGLGMAVVCGAVWGVVAGLVSFFYLNLLLASGVGYVTGEVISLAVNRKRGRWLAAIGGIAVAAGYVVSLWSASVPFGMPFQWITHFGMVNIIVDLIALALGIFMAVSRLR